MPSKIAWTDETINPIVGCSKIAAGCLNCYAERMARRQKAMGTKQYQNVVNEKGWTGELCFVPDALEKPLKWRKPKRIFVCSMSDLFHGSVGITVKDRQDIHCQIFNTIKRCGSHTFITTTKRGGNMLHDINDYGVILINLHLGISISTQKDLDNNVGYLLDTPAAVRWLSYEPAIEPISFRWARWQPFSKDHKKCTNHLDGLRKFDWVVCGCESGTGRRPMKVEWALDVARQCREANVPFFMKQMEVDGKVTDDMSKFPPELQVREYPK